MSIEATLRQRHDNGYGIGMIKAVLFDVDGTLLDTNYLHVVAWLRGFAKAGLHVVAADIHRRIGMGGDLLMEELAGSARDDIEEEWRRHYDAMRNDIRVLPGARELLFALHERGVVVGLATSSPEQDVRTICERLDADDAIAFVTSAGDVEEAKPAPDLFEVALKKAGASADEAIVVGDTVWDVEAAARCGLRCVAVLTGGISRAELHAARAVAVCEGPADVLETLGQLGALA